MSVTVNDEKFQARLNELSDVLISRGIKSDPAVILEDEMRLFLKQAIRLTPPKTKAQGEQAVTDDMKRIFTPVNEGFAAHISSAFGVTGVDQWLTNKDGQHYEIKFDKVDVQGYGMEAFHQSQRNNRGRTIGARSVGKQGDRWSARYVVSYQAFATELKKVLARVGIRKSGWLRAYYEVGGKLPAWIQRHVSKMMGRVQNNLGVQGHPSIVAASHAPGVMEDERILRETFRARGQAIKKRIKLIVSGYSKDVAAGIRISNKARKENA